MQVNERTFEKIRWAPSSESKWNEVAAPQSKEFCRAQKRARGILNMFNFALHENILKLKSSTSLCQKGRDREKYDHRLHSTDGKIHLSQQSGRSKKAPEFVTQSWALLLDLANYCKKQESSTLLDLLACKKHESRLTFWLQILQLCNHGAWEILLYLVWLLNAFWDQDNWTYN